MKKQLSFVVAIFLALIFPSMVHAQEQISGASASSFRDLIYTQRDSRTDHLRLFLESYNSPFAHKAATFINEADEHGLDWKLVAAIAGVESTFGKHIPFDSYNAWGWGIFTGQNDGIHFADWEDGISTVSEGLKKNYIDRGAVTLEQIGRRYAASPTWTMKVRFFLEKIEKFVPASPELLEVSI